MAFSDLGSMGSTGSTANNQSTLVLTTATTAAAGELVVVVIADDNQTSAADGPGNEVSGVTDSVGAGTWSEAADFANNQTGAQTGAAVSMWYSVLRTTLPGSSGITATFANATTSDATALNARHFSVAGGVSIAGSTGLANDAADPGSMNVVTSNIHSLRIRGIAAETGSNTNLTPTASWATWANGASSTSGGTGEMSVRTEHLIATTTGAASDPTYLAVDCASIYVVFSETDVLLGQMVM